MSSVKIDLVENIGAFFLGKNKPLAIHTWILIALSGLMIFIGGKFYINELYPHPQFVEWDEIANFKIHLANSMTNSWYKFFFATDAFWALALVSLLARVLINVREHTDFKPKGVRKDYVVQVFIILGALAYASDLWEGIQYLRHNFSALETWVVRTKEALYSAGGLYFIYGLLKYWTVLKRPQDAKEGDLKKQNLRSLRIFFSTSHVSILFVLSIVFIGTALPQGYTMIVDLLAKPINLGGTFLLISLIAVVVSHYPAYFEAKRSEIADDIDWKSVSIRNWRLGLVYFDYVASKEVFDTLAKRLRYHLGTAMFVAFLYLLGYAGDSIWEGFWFNRKAAFGVLLIGIWFQHRIGTLSIASRKKWLIGTSIVSLILVTIAITISANGGSTDYGWSRSTLNLSIWSAISLMLTYISFRFYRSHLYNDYYEEKNVTYKSTKKLIATISGLSFVSMGLLIFFNFNLEWTEYHTSPVMLLLLYGLNYYGILVIIIKQIQFYNEHQNKHVFEASLFRFGLPLLIPALFIYSFAVKNVADNKLHFLSKVAESEAMIFGEYVEKFKAHNSDSLPPIMYTSYGGGLMADYWALLVTQELQERSRGKFLHHTLNMSANSGGGVGFANYANLALNTNYSLSDSIWDNRIDSVGRFNHLSLDLTFLLGRDMVRKFIPTKNKNHLDRNAYSMLRYAEMTGDKDSISMKMSYRDHWRNVYEKDNVTNFPSLTVSTTAVIDGGLGNAFSLKTSSHDEIFSGIQNTLDVSGKKDSSIGFYDAVSITNRFPILSSVASIAGEGHFVDGGYYDNSGLLNSLELSRYLEKDSLGKPNFVTIANDTEQYIASVFGYLKDGEIEIEPVGEFQAVLSTGTGFDKISEHLESEIDSYSNQVQIILPRIITYQQVLSYFGGKPKGHLDAIMSRVKLENKKILKALKKADPNKFAEWGPVETPLARLLSEPAVFYEKAMLKYHPDVKKQLDDAVSFLNGCKH